MSVKEKAPRDGVRCGSERRTQVNHRGSVESVGTTPKPGSSRCPGSSAGDIRLLPAWRPALRWRESDPGSSGEPGNLSPRCEGKRPKGWTPEAESTEARHRGGRACSSAEVPVMGRERRGPITLSRWRGNPARGRNSPRGRSQKPDGLVAKSTRRGEERSEGNQPDRVASGRVIRAG